MAATVPAIAAAMQAISIVLRFVIRSSLRLSYTLVVCIHRFCGADWSSYCIRWDPGQVYPTSPNAGPPCLRAAALPEFVLGRARPDGRLRASLYLTLDA